MSTDTAFALGVLALVGPRFPDRLRAFLLTVVGRRRPRRAGRDRDGLHRGPRAVGAARARVGALRASCSCVRALGVRSGRRLRSLSASPPGWRVLESGVDPVVVGLAMGLLDLRLPRRARPTSSARPSCSGCSASSRRPSSRATAQAGLAFDDLAERAAAAALPPVDELRDRAAVRARERGHRRSTADFLARAFTSPITLGILLGYVVGKPLGDPRRHVARRPGSAAAGCGRRSAGRRSPAAARSPGIGFTVSLLIAVARVRRRASSSEAKLGVLARRARRDDAHLARLPRDRAAPAAACASRALAGGAEPLVDLALAGRPRARPHPRPGGRARSRSSSTATSSARTAGRPSRSSASCSPTSATSATCGATCR